jgi:hypothetical protein
MEDEGGKMSREGEKRENSEKGEKREEKARKSAVLREKQNGKW